MNVLLIDDHPLINKGLASYLEETGRFKVSGQVNSLTEAKRFIEASPESIFPSIIIPFSIKAFLSQMMYKVVILIE